MHILFQFLSLAVFLAADKKNLEKKLFSNLSLYVIFDSFMHLSYFMITAMPFVRFRSAFLAGCAVSVLLDIDHVIEARSFSPEKLLGLGRRPLSHSVTFILPLSLLILWATGNPALAYILFFSAASHILRDLTEGVTYPFFPSKRISSLRYPFFSAASFAAAAINIFLAKYV